MNEDFNEIYNMLSTDREDVKESLDKGFKKLNELLADIRNYQLDPIDVKDEFNLDEQAEKFKIEDIQIRSKMEKDLVNYKINLLENYLEDLFTEKKFDEYKRKKEQELNPQEYLEYSTSNVFKTEKCDLWYKEFLDL